MRLLVTRHGETQWNLLGKANGRSDVPLTQKGEQQARMLGQMLGSEGVDVIIASPLCRAAKTAECIGTCLGISPVYDERLREVDLGEFEGIERKNPEYLRAKKQLAVRFPGGESTLQVTFRVYSLIEDLRGAYHDKTVLIVAHGGVCRVLATYFEDLDNDAFSAFSLPNCQLLAYQL